MGRRAVEEVMSDLSHYRPSSGTVPRPARFRGIPAVAAGRVTTSEGSVVEELTTEDMTLCLVRTGRSHDVASFERLFLHFGPRIRSYMLKRSLDGQQAEELMQETMMMVWRKASLFDPQRGNAAAWVFTLARNVMIDSLRKARRPEFDPTDPAFVPEAPEAPDSYYEQDESAARMRRAISTLPEEQAELLRMSFFEDISHSMIAEKTNLPLGTVKSRIRAAFSRLRVALGEER